MNADESLIALGSALGAFALTVLALLIVRKRKPSAWRWLLRVQSSLVKAYGLPNKIKILIGFYQIFTKIESVYDVFLPADVQQIVKWITVTISLGIDGDSATVERSQPKHHPSRCCSPLLPLAAAGCCAMSSAVLIFHFHPR